MHLFLAAEAGLGVAAFTGHAVAVQITSLPHVEDEAVCALRLQAATMTSHALTR